MKNDNQDYHDRLPERVASLEAVVISQKESLSDISVTLKEVVKTQAMLANVREEMVKQTEAIASISVKLHETDKTLSNTNYRLFEVEKNQKEIREKSENTSTQVKFYSKVIGGAIAAITFIIPVAITIYNSFF